jgi:hypothetical protein
MVEAIDAGPDGADGGITTRIRRIAQDIGIGVWDRYPALYHKNRKWTLVAGLKESMSFFSAGHATGEATG